MNFNFIGKIGIGKETDKFKPYEEKTYDSGWINRTLLFNAICEDNRHMLTVKGGCFGDGHGDIYSFTKSGTDENGNKVKGTTIKIPFKERLTSPLLPQIAEFKKFIFDLEEPGRRMKLERAISKIKEGKQLTDEELAEMSVKSEDDIQTEYDKSLKRRKEFISEWDFAAYIKKIIDSGKYNDRLFLIKGVADYYYNEEKQQIYETLIPNRIYLAAKDAVPESIGTIKLIFNKDSLDTLSVEEKGKYFVNGYCMEYVQSRKENIPIPTSVVFYNAAEDANDKDKKFVMGLLKKFTVDDDSWKEIGLEVKMLNGAQRVEITMDMLTDEQKENIDFGLTTLEDIRKEMGGDTYGDTVKENVIMKFAKGYSSGAQETSYDDDDMVIKPLVNNDDDEDLFDDEDDDII